MPDVGGLLVLVAVLAVALGVVVGPLLRRSEESTTLPPAAEDLACLELRHRIAVESLRDVEADRRAGSLDAHGYRSARADAEERAARTLAALDAARREDGATRTVAAAAAGGARGVALAAGGSIAALILLASLLPAPLTLANGTVVNVQLAAQQRAEAARQHAIAELESKLAAKPEAAGLVQLADLYLQGGTSREVQRAANLLILAIGLDPKATDAYRLLISAYLHAGDYQDATAATDAYAKVAPGSSDIPFFRGLIAYRGLRDRNGAIHWFDAFLKAAPADPRAVMIRSLRAEAAGQLPGSTSSAAASPGP